MQSGASPTAGCQQAVWTAGPQDSCSRARRPHSRTQAACATAAPSTPPAVGPTAAGPWGDPGRRSGRR
eukprot:353711-Chlamydomonas_euryale.AAC.3